MLGTTETLACVELLSVENFIRNLQDCREKKDLSYTRLVHTLINDNGLQTLEVVGNYLVPVFVECGSIRDAQQVFCKMERRNEHSWTSLIQVFTDCGDWQGALDLFQNMQEDGIQPSKYTYLALVKACARLKFVQRGRELHAQIINDGLETDEFIGNTLVDMYAKCGLLAEAQGVFDRLPLQTVISWNALIAGYAGYGLGEEALHWFKQMQLEGISMNAITFVCSLKACGSIRALDRGQEIYSEIVKEGYESDSFIGSTMVDVYAKCGLLLEAQELFDELLVRDVVSWTALIAGYAEHGFGEQALHCLDRMQVEGVALNAVTFVCGLKACGSIGALDRGHELHGEIAKEGLVRDCAVGSSLVDMYAKCGSLPEAQDVFYELPVRDVVLWTALIAGLTEHGHGEEALSFLRQMQLEGVRPDAVTLVCSLKACASSGLIDTGQEIHAKIAEEGVEREPFVANTLVDMYAKCGLLGEAREVFAELQVHDVITWSALIAGYAEHKLDEEALDCFARMQVEGVSPDAFTFVSTLKACGNLGALDTGREMFAEIVKEELERDYFIGNTLVDMYGKCGSLVEAQEAFDNLQVRDVVSWNALILSYAESGLSKQVLNCLQQMRLEGVAPDVVTFVCSLKACGNEEAIDRGYEIHAEIAKGGFERDPLVGNSLVDMYVKCALLAEVCVLFNELPVRDVVSWNTLIAGYADQGLDEEALQCLEQMQSDGFLLDAATCVSSLKACSNLCAISKGHEIHAEIAREGFDSNPLVGNALVDLYVKCASLAEAQEVFDKLLPVRDVVSWSAIIMGYSEQGESKMALLLYKQMQEQGHLPNNVTFVSILRACGSSVSLQDVKRVDAQIHRHGGLEVLEVSLATAIIDTYAKCGSMVDAHQFFNAMPGRDLAGWNALITGYVRQGESEQVFNVFERMREEGVQPDGITFLCLLTVCCHRGLVEIGQYYYEAMSTAYGIIPSIKHHNCMIDLLGRAGQLEEAAKMLETLPSQYDLVPWSTMLGACRKWGNVELGKQAFEQAVELGEKSSAAFILMANMCADSHMLDGTEPRGIDGELQSLKVLERARFEMGSFEHTYDSG